jgi:hypothetical protein
MCCTGFVSPAGKIVRVAFFLRVDTIQRIDEKRNVSNMSWAFALHCLERLIDGPRNVVQSICR